MARRRTERGSAGNPAALFGAELRHAREARSYSQGELARLLHVDPSLVCRIERGGRVPQRGFAEGCDRVLGTGGLMTRLWAQVDWYAEVEHPDWFQRYADMEAEAVTIRQFQLARISGLLQTEDYARALFSRGGAEGAEERVAARMSRQRRFLVDDSASLVVVLDESAIRMNVGGAAVMRGQLGHLLEIARRPNIVLQVAPFDRPELRRPNTSMTMLTLPDGHRWAYSESLDRGHFGDDPAVIARHERAYDVLRAQCLTVHESMILITSLMEGYGHHDEARLGRRSMAQEQLQRGQRRRVRRGGPRIPRRRSGAGQ
ncbi:helix-turn-helix domain-containing protein [Streptacidiphilus griseoplanus]|uniref:helix-turn-helix domain-containing protein n=1 Tax=Peterkaempfera griseoplana TaxID=66896 RepID=UPI000A539DC7|nr:helix-turn-helix transcriptional regulator [Peterkaempfera griseoplana]